METKITSASIRVMRSVDFGNYEAALTIENTTGLTDADFTMTVNKCHAITNQAIDIYIKTKADESKAVQGAEKRRIGSVLNNLKELAPEKVETAVDPAEIAKVEALPMYTPKPKVETPAKRAYTKKATV